MKTVFAILLLTSAAAQAQQPVYGQPQPVYGQPVYGQPVYGQPVYPPPVYVAPGYIAARPVMMMTPDQIERTGQRGKTMKKAGGILMGVGGGVLALGIIGFVAGAVSCTNDIYHGGTGAGCGFAYLGYVGAVLGGMALTAGIPLYIVGGIQLRKAESMGFRAALLPTLGPSGVNGATASLGFQF